MGRSAKTHKRTSRKMIIQAQQVKGVSTPLPNPVTPNAQVKRKNDLKAKARSAKSVNGHTTKQKGGSILGDVDYVTLMMAGRRKSLNEANKMVEG